jgi:hypothetical protein
MDEALARDSHDNVSVQVIRVLAVDATPQPSRNGWFSGIFLRQRDQV